MATTRVQAAFWLAMAACTGAFAQVPVKAGRWELTGSFKGLPFGGATERVRTACISEAALGAIPEKALMEAAPAPTDDASKPAPKCEYSQVRRDGANSSWALNCEGPKMSGTGSATTAPDQVDLVEALELKSTFGNRSIQHAVRARRLGDCS